MSTTTALSEFVADIAPLNLSPLWERKVKLIPGSPCVPAVWHYQQMRPLLDQAAKLISKKAADRRVLVMENPSLRGSSFITNSLYAGLQIILPGEVAPCHRHTPSALRFVVEGTGAYTAIDGEQIAMHPGDFVVTPSWTWHDHGNLGDAPVVWMDGLDTPFASLFGAHFRENYPDESHPASVAPGTNQNLFGANMQPVDSQPHAQLLIYPFSQTRDALLHLAKTLTPNAAHGFKLRYTNPGTGGYPFATMAAFMQLLPSKFRGCHYRATDGTVFNVAEGECRVELAGAMHHLKPHDVFVVPPWESYRVEADESCMLFSFSDRAAQEALGYWREALLT